MATTINLTVKSDFAAASADLKKFGAVTEAQQKKIEEFVNSFKDESIQKFNDRLTRSTAAVKATRGPVAAMKTEHRMLRAEIEKLIRNGLDPAGKEIKELTTRYQKLEKEIISVDNAQKKSEASMKMTEGAMLAIGAGAIMMGKRAVDAFIDFSRESAQAASDAEEIEGKFNVVFRNISKDAGLAASSLADDFDLAGSTVNKLLGDTGDLLTGFGLSAKSALDVSEQTNRLALDLASFTNAQGGAEAVSKALTSAYANEREALKTYGIVISQADVDARKLLDAQNGLTFENEKAAIAYATLALAQEQSKNAIGDYARTSESAANVQRTLDEQIKRSKEIWGEYLNEGITPVRSALRGFLKEINDIKEENQAVNDSFKGQATNLELAISGQKNLLETQKEALKTASSYGAIDQEAAQRNIELTEQRIEQLVRLKASRDIAAQAAQDELTKTEKTAKAEADRKNTEIAALAELEKIRVSNLSSSEKEIENIQTQIDKWAEFRDVAGVQQLINELITQRNEIMDEQTEKAAAQALLDQEASLEKLRMTQEEMDAEALKWSSMDEWGENYKNRRIAASNAVKDQELANNKELQVSYKNLAANGLGALTSGFTAIGEAMANGSLSIDDFGKLILTSISQTLSALGAQLAAIATVHLLAGDVAGAALGYGESAAAFVASGVVSAAANSFEDGGFVPGTSFSGDNVQANVNSGELVLNAPQQNRLLELLNSSDSGGGGSFPSQLTLVIDGQPFIARVQQGIDNRELRGSRGGPI